MNGVHPPNYNRFRDLDFVTGKTKYNKNKRLRPDDFVPLPEIAANEQQLPRYLVATAVNKGSENEVAPLASYNVFQVERGLDFISKNRLEVTEMRSGDLLIKVPNNKVADQYLKANYIDCIPVKISLHNTLNSVQGRIFSRKIVNIPQEELLESLKSQKVVDVRKITKIDGKHIVATGAAIITFDQLHRPDVLKLGWERVPVEEYIPNPMKCQNCQKLGHTKKRCRNVEICKECGTPTPHNPCARKYCVNCQLESHTSYDPNCPTFWKHKSVNYLRISRRCTNREAWEIYNDNPTINTLKPVTRKSNNVKTYAQVLDDQQKNNGNNNIISATTSIQNKKNHVATEYVTKIINKKENNSENKITTTNKLISTSENKNSHISLYNTEITSPTENTTPENSTTHTQDNQIFFSNAKEKTTTQENSTNSTQNNQIFFPTPAKQDKIDYSTTSADIVNDDDVFFTDDTSLDNNFGLNMNVDKNLTGDMIIDEINAGLGLDSPPRTSSSSPNCETTPTTQLFNTFPELNVIITPNTFRKTKNVLDGDGK